MAGDQASQSPATSQRLHAVTVLAGATQAFAATVAGISSRVLAAVTGAAATVTRHPTMHVALPDHDLSPLQDNSAVSRPMPIPAVAIGTQALSFLLCDRSLLAQRSLARSTSPVPILSPSQTRTSKAAKTSWPCVLKPTPRPHVRLGRSRPHQAGNRWKNAYNSQIWRVHARPTLVQARQLALIARPHPKAHPLTRSFSIKLASPVPI